MAMLRHCPDELLSERADLRASADDNAWVRRQESGRVPDDGFSVTLRPFVLSGVGGKQQLNTCIGGGNGLTVEERVLDEDQSFGIAFEDLHGSMASWEIDGIKED